MMTRQATPSALDVLERVLDKGIVIDASLRVSLIGIDLASLEAQVVVASLETYLRYATQLRPVVGARHGAAAAASIRIVREAFDALNGHDLQRYGELLDDSYVSETHGTAATVRGRHAGSHALDRYFEVLPDFHFVIEAAVAAEDDVLVSWLATGTPRDEYSGASLTTRPLQIPGCTVTRLQGGRIVHAWNYWDTPTRSE